MLLGGLAPLLDRYRGSITAQMSAGEISFLLFRLCQAEEGSVQWVIKWQELNTGSWRPQTVAHPCRTEMSLHWDVRVLNSYDGTCCGGGAILYLVTVFDCLDGHLSNGLLGGTHQTLLWQRKRHILQWHRHLGAEHFKTHCTTDKAKLMTPTSTCSIHVLLSLLFVLCFAQVQTLTFLANSFQISLHHMACKQYIHVYTCIYITTHRKPLLSMCVSEPLYVIEDQPCQADDH